MSVTRATIELESVVGDHRDSSNQWVFRLASEPGVAYIRLKSFGEKTVRELGDVLKSLDNDFDALVLDLRSNGGGLLYAARDVSDMFLPGGPIVSTRTRGGKIEDSYSAKPGTLVDPSKPVAILIDENSASASEIVAACLQDNHRAIIAGTRSYGKGTVQEIMPLEYGRSALRLTVARYFRPNNKNIHRLPDATVDDEWGVTPDDGFVIPMDQAALMKLGLRWREASFPMLVGIDPPESAAVTDASPSIDDEATTKISPNSPSTPKSPGQILDDSAVAPAQPPQLTEAARENVARGPEGLADDPPLRAAVGRLLRQAGVSAPTVPTKAPEAEEPNAKESSKKAA